ncbi:Zn-ribbon domain-containing OB-fold protein [Haloarcula onubensis]|uniref:Zn-ribbon domain-containing OB-fold protein n=1 Tax=Haloarcula onubensis TaxID=2950539 RepID=A0ABU2FJS1_9EURY|nr:Zn-ribbon domain-containing OB-fold protein [Halomicroarcula sp. S3CR25-11]MDS0281004.1 Zn-ribbon domain-containing OB-fold protein [Halomicroarcula sp. S3CR25-11]
MTDERNSPMTDADSTTTGPLAPDDITADSPFTLPGFFDALADGQLVAARCTECETQMLPPRPACYNCGSRAVTLSDQPRTGEVISYTSVVRPPSAFDHLAPITVAVVELDSSARLTGRVDAPLEDVAIGDRVELRVHAPETVDIDSEFDLSYEEEWPLHVFELV